MLIETSKDILYVTLALAVVWISIFLCWALYYIIMMFRDARTFTKTIRDKFQSFLKGALGASVIGQAIVEIVEYIKNRGKKERKKKKDESDEKERHGIKIAVE